MRDRRLVGMPPSIRRAGAGACTTTPVQARQASFGRFVTSTRNWAGSRPAAPRCRRRSRPSAPQHGQAVALRRQHHLDPRRCAGSGPRPAAGLALPPAQLERVLPGLGRVPGDRRLDLLESQRSCSSGSRSTSGRTAGAAASAAGGGAARSALPASRRVRLGAQRVDLRHRLRRAARAGPWRPPAGSACRHRGAYRAADFLRRRGSASNTRVAPEARPIDAVEQRRELDRRSLHLAVHHRRPAEREASSCFQTSTRPLPSQPGS